MTDTASPPPKHQRQVRFYKHQLIGIPLLLIIPIVAVVGGFGGQYKTIVVRVVVIYLAIFLGLRILGKRELSELSPLELLTLLLIPELAQEAFTGGSEYLYLSLIGIATLLSVVFIISIISHLSPQAQNLIEGRPTVLIENGAFISAHLNIERITPDELMSEIHKAGLGRLDQVKWAILETDGKISIVPHND